MRFGRGVFSYRPGERLGDFLLYFDHAPGTGHDDKFEIVSAAYGFRKSACFQRSGGGFECTTCHDPHRPSPRDATVQKTQRVCRGCHSSAFGQLVQHGRHTAAQECVACHMPQRNAADVIHVRITDHWITARPSPVRSPASGQDDRTLPYAGEVALYYPRPLPETPGNALLVAIAQVKQLSNVPDGLSRLEVLLAQVRPETARPYFEMAEALLNTGQAARAIPFYREAAKHDPEGWRYWYGLAQGLQATGQLAAAVNAYERARPLSPDQTTVLLALGNAYAEQGNLTMAKATLRQALGRNAESATTQARLGNVLLRSGDLGGAERALREAVRLGPEVSAIRINLADVLIGAGKLVDAKQELMSALRAGPSIEAAQAVWFRALAGTGSIPMALSRYQASLGAQLAPAHVNLGTVLMMQGDSGGAIRKYQLAVAADPESGVALTNLALALMGRGDAAAARQRLEEAVRVSPGLFEAHLHLGELLLTLGDSASATAHLKRAAESPDTRVRRAATDLLGRK
jgi:predicted CXXCH cytochrome family protein